MLIAADIIEKNVIIIINLVLGDDLVNFCKFKICFSVSLKLITCSKRIKASNAFSKLFYLFYMAKFKISGFSLRMKDPVAKVLNILAIVSLPSLDSLTFFVRPITY